MVKDKQLYESYDEEYKSYVIDEDKVCDELEPIMQQKGVIVDYHGSDFFPERWFDLVVVLRTDNTILYDRLKARYEFVIIIACTEINSFNYLMIIIIRIEVTMIRRLQKM